MDNDLLDLAQLQFRLRRLYCRAAARGRCIGEDMMRTLLITTAATLLIGSAPAYAQSAQPVQQQQPTGKPAKDPNEIVCEKQEEIGSRLATQKICKTRAEWAEERRLNRMDVDKMQTQRDLSH